MLRLGLDQQLAHLPHLDLERLRFTLCNGGALHCGVEVRPELLRFCCSGRRRHRLGLPRLLELSQPLLVAGLLLQEIVHLPLRLRQLLPHPPHLGLVLLCGHPLRRSLSHQHRRMLLLGL